MQQDMTATGLNPTFFFIWKGIRQEDEENYHKHDYIEMAFIMSGQGQYRIDDVIYDIEEGDLIVLNPGVYHQAIAGSKDNPMVEFFIGFSDIAFTGMKPNCLELVSLPIYKTAGELKQRFSRICSAMLLENEIIRQGRYYMMQSYLVQLLLYLIRDKADEGTGDRCRFESVNKSVVVEKIMSYFEEHYAEKISLDLISENMYISPFYISKIFKAVTGDTPIHYLINIRLDKARELLEKEPAITIQEAAERVGYEDVYHFSKLFKKRFGTPPSRVKKQA